MLVMLACRGDPVPRLEYTAEEVAVWGSVLRELSRLYPTHACKEFLRTFPLFGFREDVVPQLEDMSAILRYLSCLPLRVVFQRQTFVIDRLRGYLFRFLELRAAEWEDLSSTFLT